MALYSGAITTAADRAGPCLEIIAATDQAKLLELSLTNDSFSSGTCESGLYRSLVKGVVLTPTTVQAEDPADAAGTVTLVNSWTTSPTIDYINGAFRMLLKDHLRGWGIVWHFPYGLVIGASSSLVLWRLGNQGSGQQNASVVIDE